MQQVGVHGVGRAASFAFLEIDRDAVLVGVGEQLVARQQVPLAPWCDDLDAGHQRIGAQFKAHLVVALACGAVRDRVGLHFFGDLDHALGDQWSGDRGTEQVFAFIQRVGAEHREDEIAHELFAQVFDEDVLFLDTHLDGLGARRGDFLALADVGGEGHHLAVVHILQPLEDDRGVEAARVGEYDLADFFALLCHVRACI